MRCGRKRKNEGIKILDEQPGVLPAQSVHLLSLGRLELPAQHTTKTDKLPPLALPHSLVCHNSRHVPRACFSYLCGNMMDFCVVFMCVPLFNKFFDCLRLWMLAGVLLSRRIKLLNIQILHYCLAWLWSFWACNSKVSLVSLCRPQTEQIHTYLAILQERSQVLLFVWVRHIFSGLHVFQSRVYSQDDTFFPL